MIPTYLEILHDTTHKNPMWACKMLPVLIYWAERSTKPHTYGELSKEVGHRTDQIGSVLGLIDDIFKELRKLKRFKELPTLNCLVVNKTTMLPSNGFSYVSHNYESLSDEEKSQEMESKNRDAYNYKKWNEILKILELKPYMPKDNSSDENTIRKGKYTHHSSEGKKHKALKEYIYNHPEVIGLKNVSLRSMEYTLLSGDRLDVYFQLKDGTQVAVEIKSEISDNADILRGIYQCVKYEAVLKAERCVHCAKGNHYPVKEILVLEGQMPMEKASVASLLNVSYKDNIKPQE